MPIYEIPTTSASPSYTQRTAIDGATYTWSFDWNARDSHWYLSLADASGDPMLSGFKMVVDADLLWSIRYDERIPQGLLAAMDMTLQGVDAGRDDLGARVQMRYYTTDEFA